MKKSLAQFSATILMCAVLAACSEKVVTAPAAAPAAPPAPSAPAPVPAPAPAVAIGEPSPAAESPAAPAAQAKAAELVCEDRKIELKADCVDLYGPRLMACTRQVLKVSSAAGDVLHERTFATQKGEGEEPDTVEEKIGAISCVRAKSGDKYIVTSMFNGGNCPDCEWFEVYDWSGKQAGSTRGKGKNALIKELAGYAAAESAPDNVFGSSTLDKFYSGMAQ